MSTIDLVGALERTESRVQRRHARQIELRNDYRAHHRIALRTLLWLGFGLLATAAAIAIAGGTALTGAAYVGDGTPAIVMTLGFFASFLGGFWMLAAYAGYSVLDAGVYAARVDAFETKHGPELADAVAQLANRGWTEVAAKDKSTVIDHLATISRTADEATAARAARALPDVSLFAGTILVWNDRKEVAAQRLAAVAELADKVKQARGDVAAAVNIVYDRDLTAEQIKFLTDDLLHQYAN